jgi:hypothetical protein
VRSPTKASLVDFLELVRRPLYLLRACPGSPFTGVFVEQEIAGYLSVVN